MNKENTTKLITDFPRLYRGRTLAPTECLMCFGFECDDGWFNLIYVLSKEIEAEALRAGLDSGSTQWPQAIQVKEKFGGLRYYMNGANDVIRGLICAAEKESVEICQRCGLPGKLRFGGWQRTHCDTCEAIYLKEKS